MSDPGPPAIDRLLAEVRAALPTRPGPAELAAARQAGALVVDIRPTEQRHRDGEMPGAVVIERNVLEWRLDPTSPHRLGQATDRDQVVIVVCNEGYASSLAAASLQQLGLRRATDLDGGYQAWRTWTQEQRGATSSCVAPAPAAMSPRSVQPAGRRAPGGTSPA